MTATTKKARQPKARGGVPIKEIKATSVKEGMYYVDHSGRLEKVLKVHRPKGAKQVSIYTPRYETGLYFHIDSRVAVQA